MEKLEKSIICFSFDDGRKDNYTNAVELLNKYNLPATFNITTGYIDGSAVEHSPSLDSAMSIDDVKEIFYNKNFEIALHGDKHLNTIEDMTTCKNKLLEWLNLSDYSFGIASPGSGMTEEFIISNEKEFDKINISYIRIDQRVKNFRRIKVFSRKVSRVIKLSPFYKLAYKDSCINKKHNRILYSVPILNSVSLPMIKSVIKHAIKTKQILILMFHSIKRANEPFYSDNWSYDYNKFEMLLKYLSDMQNKNLLSVETVINAYNKLN